MQQIIVEEKKEELKQPLKSKPVEPVKPAQLSNSNDNDLFSGGKNPEESKAQVVENKKMEFLAKAAIIDLQKRPQLSGKSELQQSHPVKQHDELKPKMEEYGATVIVDKLDQKSDSEQDEVDGNAMSGSKKEVKFKDILSAKLAKGPR